MRKDGTQFWANNVVASLHDSDSPQRSLTPR